MKYSHPNYTLHNLTTDYHWTFDDISSALFHLSLMIERNLEQEFRIQKKVAEGSGTAEYHTIHHYRAGSWIIPKY